MVTKRVELLELHVYEKLMSAKNVHTPQNLVHKIMDFSGSGCSGGGGGRERGRGQERIA